MSTATKLNPYITGKIAECTNVDALKALRAKETLSDYVGMIDARIASLTPEGKGDAAAVDLDAILGGLPKAPKARKPKAAKAPKAAERVVVKSRPFKKRVYRFVEERTAEGGFYLPARGKNKKNSIVCYDGAFARGLYEALGKFLAEGIKHPNER